VSEDPSRTAPSLGLLVQTVVVLGAVLGIPTAYAFGGRLRSLALVALGVLLLGGVLIAGYRHARRQGSLHQHLVFVAVWVVSVALSDRLARAASGRLPEPGPYLVAVCIALGGLWIGTRLAYGGALTRALFGTD
jgi:hypothetical protein